jgi:hypothetical protein
VGRCRQTEKVQALLDLFEFWIQSQNFRLTRELAWMLRVEHFAQRGFEFSLLPSDKKTNLQTPLNSKNFRGVFMSPPLHPTNLYFAMN